MIRRAAVILLLLAFFALPCSASGLLGQDDISAVEQNLNEDTLRFLKENGISLNTNDNTLSAESFLKHSLTVLKSGLKGPFRTAMSVMAIMLLTTAISTLSLGENGKAAELISSVGTLTVLAVPVFSLVSSAVSFLKQASAFMTAIVPILTAIFISGGKGATGGVVQAVLPFSAAAVSYACSFIVLPVMSAYLALGICAAANEQNPFSNLLGQVKKVGLFVLSFISAVFCFILQIKGNLAASVDSVGAKTVKFILGSSVPLVGSPLAESLSSVMGSLSVLKGSVCFYGILALCLILLPTLAEILCWRLCLLFLGGFCDSFSLNRLKGSVTIIDTMLSLLLGLMLFCLALFIISLGTVMRL